MRGLKPVYIKGLVSKKVHVVCIVHSGLAQANIPLRHQGPKALGFSGESCMHDTERTRAPTVTDGPYNARTLVGTLGDHALKIAHSREEDSMELLH